ncbi:MAG: SBBP repeat-containing protein [Promethearchaeota archaeon]
MKKKFVFIPIFIIFFAFCFAQVKARSFSNIPQINSSNSTNILIEWNITWGWSAYEWGDDIAIDENDNLYLAGTTDSFGAGGDDVFITKYDLEGNQQWNTTWGGSDHDWSQAIAVDNKGGVYVVGRCDRYWDAGDMFIAKYNGN